MTRPQKVRAVYAELKAQLGATTSPADLLECAFAIVRCAEGDDMTPRHDRLSGPTPYIELPLDVLIERHAWRIMCEEAQSEDDYIPHEPAHVLIQRMAA